MRPGGGCYGRGCYGSFQRGSRRGSRRSRREAAEAESQLAEDAQETETARRAGNVRPTITSPSRLLSYRTLETLSSMSDEQIQQIMENGTNASEVAMAANWDGSGRNWVIL